MPKASLILAIRPKQHRQHIAIPAVDSSKCKCCRQPSTRNNPRDIVAKDGIEDAMKQPSCLEETTRDGDEVARTQMPKASNDDTTAR